METIHSPAAMTGWANAAIARGRTIALVPTMGFFHEGHLSLMRLARQEADLVVVSLFVNPIQFAPGEDLERYPRDFGRDSDLARQEGVDVLFAPSAEEMYPEGPPLTRVSVSGVSEGLCGRSRPDHFQGVATVVAKLFHLVKPHKAVFGRKDLQQLAVIRRMVADLNWDLAILAHPVVREPDGLAMSSRNSYLSPQQRRLALCLYAAIQHARVRVEQGLREAGVLRQEIHDLVNAAPGVSLEYAELVDQDSLAERRTIVPGTVLALAARVGSIRLIDNDLLLPAPVAGGRP